jgi:hypothetical protein
VKIFNDVYFHDFMTQQDETMSLQSVIAAIQKGGVWLLQPKSESQDDDQGRD